jgi:hypothetical protein
LRVCLIFTLVDPWLCMRSLLLRLRICIRIT